MTPDEPNEPQVMNDKPMSAWEAAAAMGIDMRSIEKNLRLSLDERMLQRDCRLKLMLTLEGRVTKTASPPVKCS